ncbi:hypothetical protein CPB84DRAFT_1631293, partial [Gymnopilus junonius]
KHRDKAKMESFQCHGWLHITAWPESNIVLAKLSHEEDHVDYWSVDLPSEVKEMVKNHPDLNATQV